MVVPNYIYHLPFNVNKELCRILDIDDIWRDLAGIYMGYPPLTITEIEQTARNHHSSPTNELLTRWGQQNHTVPELFMLLFRMEHVTAMRCLEMQVDDNVRRLLRKLERKTGASRSTVDENGNRPNRMESNHHRESSVPVPVMLLEQGIEPIRSPVYLATTESDTSSSNFTSEESDDRKIRMQASAIPKLTYEDLREATNNWSQDNLLGKGGFGEVYKGKWKELELAVKRLFSKHNSNKEFIRELGLNKYRHDNLVPLYGYSFGGPEACLVYQLMVGGTLSRRLHNKTPHPPLSWPQRHKIAHGVAKGLLFLHTMTGTPLIHGDIKPANILLDQCAVPKIGDFGLARSGDFGPDRSHLKVSSRQGTEAYLPFEFLSSGLLSPALDVYSFGVVLMEMATALPVLKNDRPAVRLRDHVLSVMSKGRDIATLEDRALIGTNFSNQNLCREFIKLGLRCTETDRHRRPTMLEVYRQLNTMNVQGYNEF